MPQGKYLSQHLKIILFIAQGCHVGNDYFRAPFCLAQPPPFIATCSVKGKTTGIVVNGGVHGAVQALAGLPWQVTIETRDITVALAPAEIMEFAVTQNTYNIFQTKCHYVNVVSVTTCI